ncbi:helix-turn-helix transcriptional regulator [Isoptericola hypogeus]
MEGSEIRAARKRAGLSQKELGKRVGASLRTVGNWERGETSSKGSTERLIEVLRPWLKPVENDAAPVSGPRPDVTLDDLSGLVERVAQLEDFRRQTQQRLDALERRTDPAGRDSVSGDRATLTDADAATTSHDVVDDASQRREGQATARVSRVDSTPAHAGEDPLWTEYKATRKKAPTKGDE